TTRRPDSNSVRRMGMGESLVRGPVPALAGPGPPVAGAAASGPRVTIPPPAAGLLFHFHPLGDRPLFADRLQADLAHLVDLLYLDLQGVALLDRLLDRGQALALSQLGDVHQPVSAGHEVDEGDEGGRLHHLAGEPLPDRERP